jgi:hypothetical protein
MTNHNTSTISSGSGITECLTPVCSCGWKGIGYEAHNDWQHTLVKEQIAKHKAEVKLNELKGEE